MDNFSQLESKNIKNKIGLIKKYLNESFIYKKYKIIENPLKETNGIEFKSINEDKINRINSKQKISKKRNAGIDLIRIVAMIGIVYTHVFYQGKGLYKYIRYKNKLTNLYAYIFWHVNAYGLI